MSLSSTLNMFARLANFNLMLYFILKPVCFNLRRKSNRFLHECNTGLNGLKWVNCFLCELRACLCWGSGYFWESLCAGSWLILLYKKYTIQNCFIQQNVNTQKKLVEIKNMLKVFVRQIRRKV